MKQALEALQDTIMVPCYGGHPRQEAAAAALRQAIEQVGKMEPVGKWVGDCVEWTDNPYKFKLGQPLFLHPPAQPAFNAGDARAWLPQNKLELHKVLSGQPTAPAQPLTDEQIIALRKANRSSDGPWTDTLVFARAIEAHIKGASL